MERGINMFLVEFSGVDCVMVKIGCDKVAGYLKHNEQEERLFDYIA